MIELAVFMGNPGNQYSRTRHNSACLLLERIPGSANLAWRDKFHGKIAQYSGISGRCRFLQPGTAMNRSGISVSAALGFYKIKPLDLLIVHDDLELPFGQFAWRTGGGLAGHNGLKSVRDSIGTAEFRRLRLGIGRPDRGSVQSWVLGRFSPDEEAVLPLILDRAVDQLTGELNGIESHPVNSEPVRVYPAT